LIEHLIILASQHQYFGFQLRQYRLQQISITLLVFPQPHARCGIAQRFECFVCKKITMPNLIPTESRIGSALADMLSIVSLIASPHPEHANRALLLEYFID